MPLNDEETDRVAERIVSRWSELPRTTRLTSTALRTIIQEELRREPYETGLDRVCERLECDSPRPVIQPLFDLLYRALFYMKHNDRTTFEQDAKFQSEIESTLKLEEDKEDEE